MQKNSGNLKLRRHRYNNNNNKLLVIFISLNINQKIQNRIEQCVAEFYFILKSLLSNEK